MLLSTPPLLSIWAIGLIVFLNPDQFLGTGAFGRIDYGCSLGFQQSFNGLKYRIWYLSSIKRYLQPAVKVNLDSTNSLVSIIHALSIFFPLWNCSHPIFLASMILCTNYGHSFQCLLEVRVYHRTDWCFFFFFFFNWFVGISSFTPQTGWHCHTTAFYSWEMRGRSEEVATEQLYIYTYFPTLSTLFVQMAKLWTILKALYAQHVQINTYLWSCAKWARTAGA